MTNRKSYTRFLLVPKSSTLDDPERPWTAKTHSVAKMRLLEPTAQMWMKMDPYMQRQKCGPMTLVSGNIRYSLCGYSLGFLLAGPQMRVGLLTTTIFGDFSGYIFRNFRDRYYMMICYPLLACDWLQNEWAIEWPWVAISCKTRFSH